MRRAAAFLALLLCLYWTRAQGESGGVTGNDITQTEVQSEILGVKATNDQTNITPDIWAELKELRDMAIEHSVELRNSKSKMEKLELENTAIQARLTASESRNAVLEERMSSSENEVVKLQIQNAVLEARLSTSENEVEELKRENTMLEARMSTSEKEVEELKRENTDLLARVTACENKSKVLEARMSSSENEVEELKRENADRPKVAFSVALTDEGAVGPFSTDSTLKFSKIITNIGQAYSPITGIFTAPVRGAYYFRFNGFETRESIIIGIGLYHNDKRITLSYDTDDDIGHVTVSNAFVLELEKGDVIYMVLISTCGVYDDRNNRTTFSGFLLYAL
ncbi:heavy metal-binding protein HIP-like [Scomber japonicus]|uniref:heavy metal-binding protein HIP-like n=1 Tax=Scomber japonicus TaxID=13676 RepID=UPI002306BEE0|nr:heavy metal-binding protein HIP-like [Scomber japonicus]